MSENKELSYRQIIVGRFPTGMIGLDELFEALYQANQPPTDELVAELIARAREHNYIPASAEKDFAAALWMKRFAMAAINVWNFAATGCMPSGIMARSMSRSRLTA